MRHLVCFSFLFLYILNKRRKGLETKYGTQYFQKGEESCSFFFHLIILYSVFFLQTTGKVIWALQKRQFVVTFFLRFVFFVLNCSFLHSCLLFFLINMLIEYITISITFPRDHDQLCSAPFSFIFFVFHCVYSY